MRAGLGAAAFCAVLVLAGCEPSPIGVPVSELPDRFNANEAARNFVAVIDRVEPVAEATCRAQLPRGKCDFRIVVDRRAGLPPNAFQTEDPNGRPVIAFTLALIADARNQDELAFILGHEAGHHIENHLKKTQISAQSGALILGTLARLGGSNDRAVQEAVRIGATVGARRFSKEFELEADALGAVIAHRAGYDPVVGVQFFARIPDPGDAFLGTHPPNDARIALVKRIAATLR